MKNTIVFGFLLLLALQYHTLQGQQTAVNLKSIQGIQQEDFTFYDAEGYSIIVYQKNKPFSTKTIKKLKKKFGITKANQGAADNSINKENIVFEERQQQEGRSTYKKDVIYADGNVTRLVEMSTLVDRDTVFEEQMLEFIIADEVPAYIFNNWVVDSIRFVNRYITLGDACQWQNVGSIQCPYNGQMDWSVFSDEKRASQYLSQRATMTADKSMTDFISQDSVPVVFEGQEVLAQKNILKIKAPKLLMGGSNELTIYYVLAKVEGLYVACVMSHYSNDTNAPDLPPLLTEVMKLK